MRFTVTRRESKLTRLWADALADVIIRHPDRSVTPLITLDDDPEPVLHMELDAVANNETDETISPFRITNVRLTYWPGVRAARAWLSAAWLAFMAHEALELVTVGDIKTRCLDPHASRAALDHVFHTGMPFALTPETMLAALCLAVPRQEAEALMQESLAEVA
jgi:hypothetical protein